MGGFPTNAVNLPALSGNQKYALLSDDDGDFTSGYRELDSGSDNIFNNITFSGGTSYMTVAILPPPATPYLEVSKTEDDTDNDVLAGQIVTYSITIENSGLATGTQISLTDTIDSEYNTPYNIVGSGCGSFTTSYTSPTLSISGISIGSLATCVLSYDIQVKNTAASPDTLVNSVDVSAASEGGNDSNPQNADILSLIDCNVAPVYLVFETDNRAKQTFWSLVPGGNTCGVGEIASGGNTNELTCADGGAPQSSSNGNGYPDNTTITEGPYYLTVGSSYDLHVIDDANDGITTADPDIRIQQNGSDLVVGGVLSPSTVFSHTIVARTECVDVVKPEVTINQAATQDDPTTGSIIYYTIAFSEAIDLATFTGGDILISGTSATISSGPYQISPFNDASFQIEISGMSDGDIIVATVISGTVADPTGNLNNASTSTDNSVTYLATSTGEVCIVAPVNFSFSGSYVSTNSVQSGVQNTSGYFQVDDSLTRTTGYYTTLQVSDFTGLTHGQQISNTQLEWYATGVTTLSGQSNTGIILDVGWASYRAATGTFTFIQKLDGYGGKEGSYGVQPILRLSIPPYSRPDTYQATITYTLYD